MRPECWRVAVPGIALLLLLGGAGLLTGCSPSPAPAPATTALPAAAATAEAPVAAMTVDTLMARARSELDAGRMIGPAGDNAVETYLAVLEREPAHPAAGAALVEMQPMVSDGIRAALARSEWAEAERLLALLGRMDPASVLRETLGAELAQRRSEAERAAEVVVAPVAVAPVAAPPASAAVASAVPAPRTATNPPAIDPPVSAPVAAPSSPRAAPGVAAAGVAPDPAPAPPVSDASSPVAPVPAASAVSDIPARLLNNPALSYPPQARRQRIEGWVEVEVQIDASGEVASARVVRAEPTGVFDRDALRTAQRWRFAPREVDGQPVPSTARRRLNFTLGGS